MQRACCESRPKDSLFLSPHQLQFRYFSYHRPTENGIWFTAGTVSDLLLTMQSNCAGEKLDTASDLAFARPYVGRQVDKVAMTPSVKNTL